MSTAACALLCLLAVVPLMADAVEEVHLPLPPPIQGALTAGPYNFQFTGEDALRLTVVNSQTGVRVAVHYRTAPTPFTTQVNRQELAPTSDRIAATSEFAIGPGYLLNATVFASGGSPKVGQTFVKLQVIRGFGASAVVMGTIVQGYVTAKQDLAWPGSPIEDSISGGGYTRSIQGTDPGAGTPISETVPTGARWGLISFFTYLQTSAVVGERFPYLSITGAQASGHYLYRAGALRTIPESFLGMVSWAQGVQGNTGDYRIAALASLPVGVTLLAGDAVQVQALGLDGGDQFYNVTMYVREWLEVQ